MTCQTSRSPGGLPIDFLCFTLPKEPDIFPMITCELTIDPNSLVGHAPLPYDARQIQNTLFLKAVNHA